MVPAPGQRWRSLIDGHTVVTSHRAGNGLWIRFDDSAVTTMVDARNFIEDHQFIESIQMATDDRDPLSWRATAGRALPAEPPPAAPAQLVTARPDQAASRTTVTLHPETLSIELNTEVVYTAPGWSVVSTIDGRVFSRHATKAQAEQAAKRLCARFDPCNFGVRAAVS